MKLLYKKLFSYVSYKNTSYSIASLSLLTTLVLNEEIGEKVLFLGVYFLKVFIKECFSLIILINSIYSLSYC